jgi:hypothetical protein
VRRLPFLGRGRRVDLDERRSGADLDVRDDEDVPHGAVERRRDRHLHLHRLERGDPAPLLDALPRRDTHGDDDGRRGGAEDAEVVAREAVRDAVGLHEVLEALQDAEGPVAGASRDEPALEAREVLDLHLGARPVELDAVVVRPETEDLQLVALPEVAELDGPPDLLADLGAHPRGRLVELLLLEAQLVVVGLDGGREERHARVGPAHVRARLGPPLEPARVHLRGLHLGTVEQLEEERLVRRAAVEDHGALREGAPEAGERLSPVGPVGDDLGDHRVELGGDGVPLGHAAVDPEAGTRREAEVDEGPGSGREPGVGVFGVEAHLDGVPRDGGRVAHEPPAAGDVDLELHEVEARRHFRDGVLDLEARVHLEEGERPALRVVEELDGPRVAVPGRPRDPERGGFQLALDVGGHRGCGRLLEDLLVPPLDGAVADPDGPRRAVRVAEDLHLDVPDALEELLDEDGRVAEGPERLVLRALEGRGHLAGARHDADPASSPARGRLDDDRVAESLGRGRRLARAGHGPAAPRDHRDAGVFRELLGADLVAQAPHGVGRRADEDDAEPVAELGEAGVLGDEPPAGPDGVRARGREGGLEPRVVEVADFPLAVGLVDDRGGTERESLVGFPHEHRAAVGVGVEGDGEDARSALLVELADGVDEAHRGLAAVDDGHALEFGVHVSSEGPPPGAALRPPPGGKGKKVQAIAARNGSSCAAEAAPGSSTVR